MIGRLCGRVVGEDEGGVLVVDVRGVGYEVRAPLGTVGRAVPDADGALTLFIHTVVREDALELYGFAASEERDVFRTLIGIANVGPKLAMAVIGSISIHDLAEIVVRGESSKLVSIPGVGKKTAERLVLELKGKLHPSTPRAAPATPIAAPPTGGKAELLLGALTRMGFRQAEAERAVGTLAQGRGLEDAPLGDLVRDALAVLAR